MPGSPVVLYDCTANPTMGRPKYVTVADALTSAPVSVSVMLDMPAGAGRVWPRASSPKPLIQVGPIGMPVRKGPRLVPASTAPATTEPALRTHGNVVVA